MSYQNDKSKGKSDNIRIIKRNLVYVIGLDPKIANKETLIKREFLGQYGKITRLIVNFNKAYTNNNSGPSYSAYINYNTEEEAALAILSIDSTTYNGKQIKAAFGTTKYCAYYLKKITCPNRECVYIHTQQDKCNIISKESSDFYIEQHKIAIKVADISNPQIKELLYKNRHEETQFPNPYTVYFKKSIISQLKSESDRPYRNNASNTKTKGLNNYFDTNNEDYYVKTVIKEINYDEDKVEINETNEKETIINNSTNNSETDKKDSRSSSSKKENTSLISQRRVDNSSYRLFKLEDRSKFDFANTKEQSLDEIEHQSKFLQQYYMRLSFSNLVNTNTCIEEEFFNKLKISLD